MTLPSSGAISLGNLKNEFGGNDSPKLSDYYRNGSLNYNPDAVVPKNGTISFSTFYGLSKRVHTVFKTTTDTVVFQGIGSEIIQYSDGTTETVPTTGKKTIKLKALNGVQTIIHPELSGSYSCGLAGPGLTEILSISNNPALYCLQGYVVYNGSSDPSENDVFDRSNLVRAPKYLPRNIIDLYYFFYGASSFNQNIGNWDVGNVTRMSGMFNGASSFNQNIGNWDVGNVTRMSGMFANAIQFNQNIGNWDVSKVTRMSGMFANAKLFNRDISQWNVSNVTDMTSMFYGASSFNQNIGNWDVGNVTDMSGMFNGASSFNQNIGNWNVGNVTDMTSMFAYSGFNTNIASWCVSKIRSRPTDFALGNSRFVSGLWPRWGTCSRGW